MSATRRVAPTKRKKDKTLQERWAALLQKIDEGVPVDATDEEIDKDIAEAIEEARRGRRARRP